MNTNKNLLTIAVLLSSCSLFAEEAAPAIEDSPAIEQESAPSSWSYSVAGDYFDFESGATKVLDIVDLLNDGADYIDIPGRTGDITGGTVSIGWNNQLFFDFSFASGDSEAIGTSSWGSATFDERLTFSEDWKKLRVRWDVGALSGEHFKGYLSGGYQIMTGSANYSYNLVDSTTMSDVVDIDSDAHFASIGIGMALNQPAGAFNLGLIGEIQGVFGGEEGVMDPNSGASNIGLSDEDYNFNEDEIFGLEYTVTAYVNYPFESGAIFLNLGYRMVSWGDEGGSGTGYYNDGDLKGIVGRLGLQFSF